MKAARDRHLLKPETPELIAGAIKGLLAFIDSDAEVLPQSAASEHPGLASADPLQSYGLVAKRLPPQPRRASPGLRVVSAADGSPAAGLGLSTGDVLTHIGDKRAGELSRLDLLRMTAEPRADLLIRFERKGSQDPVDALLQRHTPQSSTASSMRSHLGVASIAPGTLHVRPADVGREWIASIAEQADAGKRRGNVPILNLIIDLRDMASANYAGAIELADAFLESGEITRLQSRQAGATTPPTLAQTGSIARDMTIAVLINAGTAGASEVLAAALKDNQRAMVIGMPSAGQATVRGLAPIGPSGARGLLYLPIARYLTPKGQPLDKTGVKPDLEIKSADAASGPCRAIDLPSASGDGTCIARTLGTDDVLKAAIVQLARAPVATAKP